MTGFKSFRNAPAKVDDDTSELMCIASGCPNRWSVDAGSGKRCSAHAWAEPHEWPGITQQQQWNETERAQARSNRGAPPPARRMVLADKLETIRRIKVAFEAMRSNPRAWVDRLRARKDSGERLTHMQRQMLGSAADTQVEDA